MDFSSGLLWSEISDILMNIFDSELANIGGHDERKGIIQLMQSFLTFFSQREQLEYSIVISGSIAEGTQMNPSVRREAHEMDLMTVPSKFTITRDMQPAIFKDVPDEPGFVRLEAPDTLSSCLVSDSLQIKQVIHSCGRSRSYIVQNIEESFKLSTFQFQKSSKNILVQSGICDALQLGKLSLMGYQQGPAFTNFTTGFIPALKSLQKINLHPKSTFFKFLGRLGARFLEEFDDNKPEGETNTNMFEETVDFMNTTHANQIPGMPEGLMMDICPAIKCEGWPHKALRFFHRTRVWPDHTMLNKLLQTGFHLVYKPLNPLAQDSVEWRISFSQAEIALFQNMDAFRVCCYRIFKAIYYCELTLPKVLSSYHMKTIFLWACERIPSEMWVESNLAQIIMGLLDDLLHCLVTKNCPHYFIPENNLFAHVHQDFLNRLAKVVTKIRRNPQRCLSVLKNRTSHRADRQDTEADKELVSSSLGEMELD